MTCSDGEHLNCTGEVDDCGCVWEYCKECSYSVCYQMCDTCFDREHDDEEDMNNES
jgi:hypothetical protein